MTKLIAGAVIVLALAIDATQHMAFAQPEQPARPDPQAARPTPPDQQAKPPVPQNRPPDPQGAPPQFGSG